jgi:hypothetical protein
MGRKTSRKKKLVRDDLVRKAEAAKMLPERSGSLTAAHDAVRPFPFGCYQEGQSAAPAEGTMTGLPACPFMARRRTGPRVPETRSWEDITPAIKMPHYHVVSYCNGLPRTMCKAVAKMPQDKCSYPFNDGRNRVANHVGIMPTDFPT